MTLTPEEQAQYEEDMRRKEELIAKQKAIEDEERRVAAMSFDMDSIVVPFDNMRERAKYIPLRLTYEERKSLRLVNAAINVSVIISLIFYLLLH